jgi:hypothetical protein
MCSANYFTINTHTLTTLFKTHIAFDGDKSTSENEKAEITRETPHAIALLLQTGYNTVTKSKKKKNEMKYINIYLEQLFHIFFDDKHICEPFFFDKLLIIVKHFM